MGKRYSIFDIYDKPSGFRMKLNKNKSFLIDEYYCINPICDCQNVNIVFR